MDLLDFFRTTTTNDKNLNSEIETETVGRGAIAIEKPTNDKNLNSEIETSVRSRASEGRAASTNDKNLNSEIETISSVSAGASASSSLRMIRISILRLKPKMPRFVRIDENDSTNDKNLNSEIETILHPW